MFSDTLIAICERAMARNKEDRYPTAKELGVAVYDWLEGTYKEQRANEEIDEQLEYECQRNDKEFYELQAKEG